MSKSEQYLEEAFAGESQANRKYLAFAANADKEGYPQAAKLFRAAAEAETAPFSFLQLIVFSALLSVAQYVVGLLDLLKPLLCRFIIGILVRVILLRQRAIGLLNVIRGGVFFHPKKFVVISLCHVLKLTETF